MATGNNVELKGQGLIVQRRDVMNDSRYFFELTL